MRTHLIFERFILTKQFLIFQLFIFNFDCLPVIYCFYDIDPAYYNNTHEKITECIYQIMSNLLWLSV